MKTLIVIVVLAMFAAFAWYLLPSSPRADAEQPSGGHAGHAGDPAAVSEGVVLSVDRAARMVSISHGPLRNLGMPPMTMGFQVADPAMFDRLKTGDRVKFHANAVGGVFTATSIEIAN
jgi:Cu/Ag efflux protein CusF